MLFPPAKVDHEASPLLNDQPPGQVHVVPTKDAKVHVVKHDEVCWCGPQVQDEGAGHITLIHKPVSPVVIGHKLALRKILVGQKDGIGFAVELPST